MEYIFAHAIPLPWLLADLLTVALSAILILFVVHRTRHPGSVILECRRL
jgi:hypothetical protein